MDLLDKPYDATIRHDTSYFPTLNTLVQAEPWLDRDRALIDWLTTLDIGRGQPYAPDRRYSPNSARRNRILGTGSPSGEGHLSGRKRRSRRARALCGPRPRVHSHFTS